jgi:hypothetical protein
MCAAVNLKAIFSFAFRTKQTGESKQDAKRADPEATSPECDGEDICEVFNSFFLYAFGFVFCFNLVFLK